MLKLKLCILLQPYSCHYIVTHYIPNIKICSTNLHQPLQLVELAVKILKVVLVESPEAVVVHYFHQHAESLFLRHLKRHGPPVDNKPSNSALSLLPPNCVRVAVPVAQCAKTPYSCNVILYVTFIRSLHLSLLHV